MSQALVSTVERGHLDTMSLRTFRRVAAVLDIRIDLTARWRAGDLDRLLNARHSSLHELVARWFAAELPEWVLAPEVSFAIYGERGVIDILAWHQPTRSLLVIELKTAIADVNELLGTADRKRRLAAQVARDRGWDPRTVSQWLIVADTRTNRRRLDAHMAVIRNAFPAGTWAIRRWLRRPRETIAAVTVWAISRRSSERAGLAGVPRRGGRRGLGRAARRSDGGLPGRIPRRGGAAGRGRGGGPGFEGSGALLTIADGCLTVRLTRDLWQLEPRHVELARAVSAVARRTARSPTARPSQEVQLAIAAKPDAIDVGFWRAVLGYAPMADDNAVDPLGHGSTVWMQELDEAKPLRHAMHVDVSVAREHVEARLAAALAAGGRVVDESEAPGLDPRRSGRQPGGHHRVARRDRVSELLDRRRGQVVVPLDELDRPARRARCPRRGAGRRTTGRRTADRAGLDDAPVGPRRRRRTARPTAGT